MIRNDLMVLLCLALVGAAVADQAPAGPLSLSQGTYRFEGQCLSMIANSKDETFQCLMRSAIIIDDSNHPSFVFSRTDGVWVFKSSGDPQYSNDAKTATYPITRLLDSSTKRALDLPGKCVLNADSHPTLTCAIWLESGENVRSATFDGNGTWSFSRNSK